MSYDIYEIGYDKHLNRSKTQAALPELGLVSPQPSPVSEYSGGFVNLLSTASDPQTLSTGTMSAQIEQAAGALYSGKNTFTDTTNGYRLGIDTDGDMKLVIGTTGSQLDWNVTTADTLTITGIIHVSSGGTIAGFDIGSDYIRDVANSFGLASTVTGADDVRFWAGDTFANRATAAFRVTEAGVITATSATITGVINATSGKFGTATNYWSVGSSGLTATSASTDVIINYGKTDFDNTQTGFILGYDFSALLPKFYIGTTTAYFNFTGSAVSIRGAAVDYPTMTNLQAGSEIAIQGWQFNGAFSATDADTAAWGAGTLTLLDGTTYSIGAGNTGNISALTYIYLDIAVSTTAFQTTTTAATAVGSGKILVAVAQNNSDATSKATFQVFGGSGGQMVAVGNLAANSATTNEFISNTAQIKDLIVTNAKINDLVVSKLTAGTITSKTIALAVSDGSGDTYIAATKTDFTNVDTGFILGVDDSDANTAKFYIGSSTKYLNWDGTDLTIAGNIIEIDTSTGAVRGDISNLINLTFGEAIDGTTTPQTVYLKSSDGKVYKADANTPETAEAFLGLVIDSVAAEAAGNVIVSGSVTIPSQTLTSAISSTVDQAYNETTGPVTVWGINLTTRWFAQTFKVGDQVGNIEKVEIYTLTKVGSPVLTIHLYAAATDGSPTGSSLVSVASISPTNGGYTTATFASPYAVNPGDVYCIVVQPTTADGSNSIQIGGETGAERGYNAIAGSDSNGFAQTGWNSTNSGTAWNADDSAVFQTYTTLREITYGDPVFMSETGGGFSLTRVTSAGAINKKIGRLISQTKLLIEPRIKTFIGATQITASLSGNRLCAAGVPPRAEECIIDIFGDTTQDTRMQVHLTKTEITSQRISDDDDTVSRSILATWSGNVVTLDDTGNTLPVGLSTVYFYT